MSTAFWPVYDVSATTTTNEHCIDLKQYVDALRQHLLGTAHNCCQRSCPEADLARQQQGQAPPVMEGATAADFGLVVKHLSKGTMKHLRSRVVV